MKKPNAAEYAIFPDRLKAARDLRALSLQDLAILTDITPNLLMRLETGARKPSSNNLTQLAKALKVSIDYLLGTVHDPKPISLYKIAAIIRREWDPEW
jgi:transcriptional regulator with XRE-family HTH domain